MAPNRAVSAGSIVVGVAAGEARMVGSRSPDEAAPRLAARGPSEYVTAAFRRQPQHRKDAAATDSGRRPGRPFAGPNVLMALIVQKFGGTSVADVDRIRSVALRVKREVDSGNRVAVVVSAMAGATNQLVDWVRETAPLHDSREYDVIVASGE